VMKRGDSGGMVVGCRGRGVLLKGRRHGAAAAAAAVRGLGVLVMVLVVVVVVVEIRQEERAAWRPHIDGRESGDAILGVLRNVRFRPRAGLELPGGGGGSRG
jgi:hypothetical protein